VANIRVAVIRLLEKAQQGSRLSVHVNAGMFAKEEEAEVVNDAAVARHTAGIPGGVPALIVK
jgi:hypothetical protein